MTSGSRLFYKMFQDLTQTIFRNSNIQEITQPQMPSLHVNMFSYYYVPIIRLVGTNLNKMVGLLRYSGLSSQNMYIKKKNCTKRFCFWFSFHYSPRRSRLRCMQKAFLKLEKNKTKHVLTVKKAQFLEGIRTERAS